MVIQKFKIRKFEDKLAMAQVYYKVLTTWYDIKLTKRHLELLAFVAVRGTISSVSSREEFCEKFKSSKATINNLAAKLQRMQLLIKENNKIKINPQIALNLGHSVEIKLILEKTWE